MTALLIDADVDELLHSAVVLHRVAGGLTESAHALTGLSSRLLRGPAPEPLVPALIAPALFRRAASLDALARELRTTALRYRAADAAGAMALAMVLRAVAGPLLPPAGLATTGDAVAGLGRMVSLAGPWLRESFAVTVVARPGVWTGPATGAEGVLARVPAEGLHVERLTLATGGSAWLVGVPGTSDWSPRAARTPFDLTGDVRLMAGQASAGQAAVLSALRSLGVRAGEPVMLAGHSQGGLVAASLAARADVRREFTITQVVTSGAPVALIDLPRSVNTLSIEHTDDPVPKADGRANPVHPGRITVRAPSPGLSAAEPLGAHRAGLYRRTAALVDRTPDPALAEWRASAAPFLTAADGEAWDFTVTR